MFLLIAALPAVQLPQSASAKSAETGPANLVKVTGYYRARSRTAPNSMEVLQLPGGKIKFHILALWVRSYNRENVHNGEAQGIVELKGNSAVYEADHCKLTIRFTGTTAIVKQADEVGDCDFGANVTATGIYRRVDSRKPKFDF
jgi:hypothetical protein